MDDYIDSEGEVSNTKKRNGSDADNVQVSMSEEEESQMESEDEEKDLKAVPAPTIEGEVPCVSLPMDEDDDDRKLPSRREVPCASPLFSALEDSFQTCCHPEFLLNKQYRNEHTKRYAELWDEIYSEIQSYFGNPDECIEGNNIVMKVDGSVSFELLKKAAEEKNARTSKRLIDLAERGEHPWQQPEFINAHSETYQ